MSYAKKKTLKLRQEGRRWLEFKAAAAYENGSVSRRATRASGRAPHLSGVLQRKSTEPIAEQLLYTLDLFVRDIRHVAGGVTQVPDSSRF
jgi:hypothetical protein